MSGFSTEQQQTEGHSMPLNGMKIEQEAKLSLG